MLLRAPVICTVFIDIPCITVRKLFPLSQFLGYMFSHITYYTTDYIHEAGEFDPLQIPYLIPGYT